MTYAPKERKTVKYTVIEGINGRAYTFYCDLSGAVFFKTKPISADTPEKEFALAWEEAKQKVNVCLKCGRNVINALYNADTMECVKCSPWQKPPVYCTACGTKLLDIGDYCAVCGKRIHREGADEDADC